MSKQMKKYNSDFKLKVVLKYLTGNSTISQLCQEFEISKATLNNWNKQFKENSSAILGLITYRVVIGHLIFVSHFFNNLKLQPYLKNLLIFYKKLFHYKFNAKINLYKPNDFEG